MTSHQHQRLARVPPHLAWNRPGLPTKWVRVLECHPDGIEALPGDVWLDTPGKPRHVQEHEQLRQEVDSAATGGLEKLRSELSRSELAGNTAKAPPQRGAQEAWAGQSVRTSASRAHTRPAQDLPLIQPIL